jgi:uncharacterized protein (DUF4415 family)
VRFSREELRRKHESGQTIPTPADAPTIELDDEFWDNAFVVMPGETHERISVHLRLSPDVFNWFKAQGKGHVTRMQEVLRAYYEAHVTAPKRKPRKPRRPA